MFLMQKARNDDLCGLSASVLIRTLVHFNRALGCISLVKYKIGLLHEITQINPCVKNEKSKNEFFRLDS